MSKNQQNGDRKVVQLYRKEKEKGCSICGYDKCVDAICYHHPDPNDKKFGIATAALSLHVSWEVLKEEMDKCMRVCLNCHAELHSTNK